MKILCLFSSGGSFPVRSAWQRVFEYCGHTWQWWNPQSTPVFDAFDEFEPDIFIGTTYDLNKSIIKCVKERPNLKVLLIASNWGPIDKEIDKEKFPVLTVSEKEKALVERLRKETGKPEIVTCNYHEKRLNETMSGWEQLGITPKSLMNAADTLFYAGGVKRKELECDGSMVSGFWGYKARNLVPYIFPLLFDIERYNIKIWGNQGNWSMVPQYLGYLANPLLEKDVFASSKVVLNVHEPHSTEFHFDHNERTFKALGVGAFVLSDYVGTLAEDIFVDGEVVFGKTPTEYREAFDYYLGNEQERKQIATKGQKTVLSSHTYFHRVASIFEYLGLTEEARKVIHNGDRFNHNLQGSPSTA